MKKILTALVLIAMSLFVLGCSNPVMQPVSTYEIGYSATNTGYDIYVVETVVSRDTQPGNSGDHRKHPQHWKSNDDRVKIYPNHGAIDVAEANGELEDAIAVINEATGFITPITTDAQTLDLIAVIDDTTSVDATMAFSSIGLIGAWDYSWTENGDVVDTMIFAPEVTTGLTNTGIVSFGNSSINWYAMDGELTVTAKNVGVMEYAFTDSDHFTLTDNAQHTIYFTRK